MTAHEGLARRVPWLVAAVSLWLTAGVVSPTGPEPTARIGVLPPFWIVPALLLAAAAIGPMIPCRPARLRPLYLSLLLWLPWLPLPIPAAFLLWHGPLSCVVWIVIAGLLVAPLGRAWWDRVLAAAPTTQIALVILLAAGVSTAAAWRMAPVLPGGDEAHYLVIAQSLLYDGDLKIENNHRRGDYRAYIGVDLKPDYLRRGVDREIYSIHAPGLPVLVLPAFAVAGYPGVLVFLSIVSAVGAALVWRAAWRITGDASAAWAGWASVALSAPFLLQSFTAYPDGPAAVLVMTGVYALALPESMSASRWRPAVLGAALAALPWLHTRYAVLAGVLGVLIVWRLWQPGDAAARPAESTRAHPLGRCLAFLAIPVVSAAAWLWLFYAIYGELNPAAPYGGYTQSSLANAPRGLVGLLIDQQFGVLPNAPVYVVGVHGGRRPVAPTPPCRDRAAARCRTLRGRSCLLPHVVGRIQLAGALPRPRAVAVRRGSGGPVDGKHAQGRSTFAVLLGVSIVLAAALVWVDHGALVYNFRDGFARWMDRAAPLVNLPRALPTQFRNARLVTAALVVAWAGAALASWLFARLAARAWNEDGTAMRGWCALACTLMIGATLGWRIAGAAPLETGTGLLRVAGAAAGRGVVVTLPALRRETTTRAFADVRVPSGNAPRPAGRRVAFRRAQPPGGTLSGDCRRAVRARRARSTPRWAAARCRSCTPRSTACRRSRRRCGSICLLARRC